MDYTEIVDMALSFADRADDEVTTRMDKFLLMAESRINKKLKVADMSARATIDLTLADVNQSVFALPTDFGGLRSIKIVGAKERVLSYINEEQFANRKNFGTTGLSSEQIYYNIVAKELHLYPYTNTGSLSITYYQKVPALTSGAPNNWISDDVPECYIYALCVEITAFAKDVEAFKIWESRFIDCIDDIQLDDAETRWSGTPLQIHVG